MPRVLAIVFFLLAMTVGASAHSPIKGIGVFYNGLLHPFLVPAHVLALVAIGLLLGQQAPRASRLALPAFAMAMALALAAIAMIAPAVPPWAPLTVALIAGLAVALSWSGGALPVVALAVAAGALVALDSAPDGVPDRQVWLALVGAGLGTLLVVVYCGGLAAWLDRPWQKIAVRALGSWIAASALMVLTFELLKPASTQL